MVMREVAMLDPRTRAVLLLLRFNDGYEQQEVAERTGMTRKAVEMIVRRQAQRGRKRSGQAS
jgi:DNA-directed RNA polymerase specialized sigma24 family protein